MKWVWLLVLFPGIASGSFIMNPGSDSGGGGGIPVETIFGSANSSPTATIIGQPGQFTGAVSGSTMTFALDSTSVTLQGNALRIADMLSQSSATATYLQGSSATATYLQSSSATAIYLQSSSATTTYLQSSSATATYCFANGVNCTAVAGGGDSLGSHIATQTVTANYGLIATTVTVSSNTILSNATFYHNAPAQIGNVRLTGYLGIGKVPTVPIDLSTTVASGNLLSLTNTAGTGNPFIVDFNHKVMSPVYNIYNAAAFLTISGNAILLNNANESAGHVYIIPSAGSMVGINTTAPTAGLHVVSSNTIAYSTKISTAATGFHVAVSSSGHLLSSGSTPVASSCGTSPSVVGTDNAFTLTVGGTTNDCTVTFSNTFGSAPTCLVSPRQVSVLNALSYTVAAGAMTFNETGLDDLVLDIICIGRTL